MDTYVVVHIKNKEEKVKVCSVLAAETEAEFKVTMDLKAFVAEKYNVNITDYVEMKDQATGMGQEKAIDIITVKDEVVSNTVDPPTIDNNKKSTSTSIQSIRNNQKMDTYVVVHIKNKEEKVKVCNALAAETEAEFKVTTDLKTFLAEKYNVNITDKVEMKDQATDTIQENAIDIVAAKSGIVNIIVDVVPFVDSPTIDSNMDTLHGQHTDMADIQPSNVMDTQTHPSADSQRELFNIGTYVPYRDRMVETKEEVIDEHERVENEVINNIDDVVSTVDIPTIADNQQFSNIETDVPYQEEMIDEYGRDDGLLMEMEGELGEGDVGLLMEMDGDGIDNYDIDNESVDNTSMDKDIQSTSTKRRSGRVPNTKKRAVDESNTVTDAPSSSRRSGRMTKRPRYSMDDDLSTTRRSGRVTKQSKYSIDDDSDTDSECNSVIKKSNIATRKTEVSTVNYDIDDESTDDTIDKGIQSTSTKRRSGRDTKRPRYSMDDDSDDSENAPNIKKSNKSTSKSENSTEKSKNNCKKCGREKKGYLHRLEHVLKHAKMTKYECTADGCGYKVAYSGDMRKHMKEKHGKAPNSYREVQFTREQTEQFDKMMEECFPVTNENDENNCQICHQNVSGKNSPKLKKEHALHHVDFLLYKCMEKECHYEGKTVLSMQKHNKAHKFAKIELTKEQEVEIEEMVKKCFPGLDKDNNEDDESNE